MADSRAPAATINRLATSLDVGIVHEWLTTWAGSEKCVGALAQAFPQHRIYASVMNADLIPLQQERVKTSLLQKVPAIQRSHVLGLPLMPLAMRCVRVSDEHDLLIRSFHTLATLPPSPAHIPEIVYCYTPPRFIYGSAALSGERRSIRLAARAAAATLKPGDQKRMRRKTNVVAISSYIRRRIKDEYGIEARVLHPPVDVERFQAASSLERGEHFVLCSRLVAYKRPDLAIEAFRGLPHQLTVIGDGRLRKKLQSTAPPNVRFLGYVPDADLPRLLGSAQGFIFPAAEDFGIALVEALAAGTPLIAYAEGGVLDYVEPGRNGVLVTRHDPRAFADAICQSAKIDWDHSAVARSVSHYSPARFIQGFRELAAEAVNR